MTSDFLTAVYSKAKASAPFSGAVTGPWTPSTAPAGSAFPYGIYSVVGSAPLDWSTNNQSVEPVRIQFSVYAKGGEVVALNYAKQIQAAFAIGTTLSTGSGHILGCMPIFGPAPIPCTMKDADGAPVFHAVVDVRFWFQA